MTETSTIKKIFLNKYANLTRKLKYCNK